MENENNSLLEALTSFEEQFAGVEDLKSAVEMIQKHIGSMGASQEEEMKEHTEDEEKEQIASEEKKEEMASKEEEMKEEEKYEATEEETNEAEVEEQFAAEQKAEEVEEKVEDKTVVFSGITPEKVNMINNFFNRK